MESSPLIQAHTYARSALSHAQSHNNTSSAAAAEEHAHAAGEFARAAKGSGDAEALRTLQLLERHHQKLHRILKSRSSSSSHPAAAAAAAARNSSSAPQQQQVDTVEAAEVAPIPAAAAAAPPPSSKPAAADRSSSPYRHPPPHQLPTLNPTQRSPARDLTSSIASNLASARGIPSSQRRRGPPISPALSADQAGGKILASSDRKTDAEPSRRLGGQQADHTGQTGRAGSDASSGQNRRLLGDDDLKSQGPSTADTKLESAGTQQQQETTLPSGSEPFQRFYSTFESLISKLSAPLAFAGLPLSGDVTTTTTTTTTANPEKAAPIRDRSEEHERVDPDLSRIFSKAALRAVKERTGPGGLGTAGESFYVVPTTGGTISYANILSRAEEERRAGLEGQVRERHEHDDEEPEFVDASETPQPPSPEKSRHSVGRPWRYGTRAQPHQARSPQSTKTMEELQVENQALKQLSDTLSRRLHMWEMNAQSSSMALQHSLRALQRSQAASDGGKTMGDDDPAEKLKQVEEEFRRTRRELEKIVRENEKLRGVVARYRDKWEKLKEGARMRRDGNKAEDAVKE
ncbi:MAG: hypothetical protein M1816_007567 [Peltula sp. TS41687]|nr:MAG: hypothetical protein M1816_007567 [Peltula sp. TS41687]